MNDFESKAKQIINELNKKIDELLEKSEISKDDIKKEINERINELKKARDKVESEFQRIREENKETIDKIEVFAKNALGEARNFFEDVFSKFTSEKKKD